MIMDMKKEQQIKLRNEAWKYIWEKYKNEYTMDELSRVFDTSIATFWRACQDTKAENNQ
jgi:AraC-like DNA-binding protein